MKRTEEIRARCLSDWTESMGFMYPPSRQDLDYLLDRCEALEKIAKKLLIPLDVFLEQQPFEPLTSDSDQSNTGEYWEDIKKAAKKLLAEGE